MKLLIEGVGILEGGGRSKKRWEELERENPRVGGKKYTGKWESERKVNLSERIERSSGREV